jgi:CHASE1-domain containing sensor protein
MLQRWESQAIETEFQVEAADHATAIKNDFERQISLLELIQSAYGSVPNIDRRQFNQLLEPFQKHAPSIVAVEWAPRVAGDRREEYENAARRDGIENFQFTEQTPDGQMVPDAKRDEYFPVYYIGPKQGNPLIFGYDLASEPTRFEAVCRARDTGKAQASGRITFVQDQKVQNGFLIFLPVYQQGQPLVSVEDRRQNFRGTVLGVFHPRVLIETALAKIQPEGVDVLLYDSSASAGNRPFYFHASRNHEDPANTEADDNRNPLWPSRFVTDLDVAGHHWTIECRPIPYFITSRQTWWPGAALVAGLVFTVIVAAYLMLSLERRAFAERLVQEKRLYARGLEAKVHERTDALRIAQEETIQRLVTASLWRDEETGNHIRRTGLFCEALARAAGWSTAETEILRLAALMHDVGKIGIPDAILRKPGKLAPEEYEVIKTHTLIGAEMLSDSRTALLIMAREIALYHHEHWDGQGYPVGLSGQQIPEAARIMAIVDVFDALTHDRAYRRAMTDEAAVAFMLQDSGSHFDPTLMALFVIILPEITRLSQEYPDDMSNNRKLARSFASIMAGSNTTEAEVLAASTVTQPSL